MDEAKQREEEYKVNQEGCYILNVADVAIDATRTFDRVGRYINHARKNTNLKLFRPLSVGGVLRVAIMASRDVEAVDSWSCSSITASGMQTCHGQIVMQRISQCETTKQDKESMSIPWVSRTCAEAASAHKGLPPRCHRYATQFCLVTYQFFILHYGNLYIILYHRQCACVSGFSVYY